ncbi:MAG: right-handed parallel beta-helix repeat-containing protein [Planctomycetota bacterium]
MIARAAAVLVVTIQALAGPLTPPAGTPAPTDTALRNTDPRTPLNATTAPSSPSANHVISTPGTYFLTGDIIAEQNKTAIQINAIGVTLDLNGFELIGLGLFTTVSVNGISPADGAVIRNGHIRDFTAFAIEGNFDDDLLIENITVRDCGAGIATSTNSRVLNCAVYDTDASGIRVGNASLVEGCVSDGNTQSGIVAGSGSIVLNATASNNGADGVFGNANVLIQGCVASENATDGIQMFFGGSVIDCVSSGNTIGFTSGASTLFHRCHAYDNSNDGFELNQGCVARACVSISNEFFGYRMQGAQLVDSVARGNSFSGINLVDDCVVRECHSFQNDQAFGSGAGIRAEGTGNVIQNNISRDNGGFGIQLFAANGNRVFGNWSLDNTGGSYAVPLGNAYGPYVNVVDGNISGQAFSDHPLANFQN